MIEAHALRPRWPAGGQSHDRRAGILFFIQFFSLQAKCGQMVRWFLKIMTNFFKARVRLEFIGAQQSQLMPQTTLAKCAARDWI